MFFPDAITVFREAIIFHPDAIIFSPEALIFHPDASIFSSEAIIFGPEGFAILLDRKYENREAGISFVEPLTVKHLAQIRKHLSHTPKHQA